MIHFVDSDWLVNGEVYEQMDNMLGLFKDIVECKDVNLYIHIRIEVEKWWEKLPKYYHTSWLQALAISGVVKSKAQEDPEVQAGYMQALDKLILMRSVIPYRNNRATISMATMVLGPTM